MLTELEMLEVLCKAIKDKNLPEDDPLRLTMMDCYREFLKEPTFSDRAVSFFFSFFIHFLLDVAIFAFFLTVFKDYQEQLYYYGRIITAIIGSFGMIFAVFVQRQKNRDQIRNMK